MRDGDVVLITRDEFIRDYAAISDRATKEGVCFGVLGDDGAVASWFSVPGVPSCHCDLREKLLAYGVARAEHQKLSDEYDAKGGFAYTANDTLLHECNQAAGRAHAALKTLQDIADQLAKESP